jgi:ribosome maturation factor RimP
MSNTSTREALLTLMRPVVESDGVDLEDIEVIAAGKRRLVRLLVDRDGGLDLDAVTRVSRAASAALDAADAADGVGGAGGPLGRAPYVLEVSSPGVERPLTAPRHWRRARARLVLAELVDGTSVTGRVVHTDQSGTTLEVEGTERHLGWDAVRRGRVQVEFTHPVGDDTGNDDDAIEPEEG